MTAHRTLVCRFAATLASAALLLGLCAPAHAHKGSDAYLGVRGGATLALTLSIALKDLDLVVPLDANSNAEITWGEVKLAVPLVIEKIKENVVFKHEFKHSSAIKNEAKIEIDNCLMPWRYDALESRSDGTYLRLAASAACDPSLPLTLHYSLFAQEDVTHRLIVAGSLDGRDLLMSVAPTQAAPVILRESGDTPQKLGSEPAGDAPAWLTPWARLWSTFWAYGLQGAEHLLLGYDHMAFLLALLLPMHLSFGALVSRRPRGAPSLIASQEQQNAVQRRLAWRELLATVTAFTVGHSLTLVLAVLGYTSASPAWVEPLIALSIGVSACLNLFPPMKWRTVLLAGVFGLVHGYGFAGLLTQADAPDGLLGWALAGFNLGLEAGQLLVVCVWVAVSQQLIGKQWYRPVVVQGGSVLLMLLSLYWLVQRVG